MRTTVAFVMVLLGVTAAAGGQAVPASPTAVVPKLPPGVTAESLSDPKLDPKEAARVADWLDKEYPRPQPESVRMLVAILRKGTQVGGSDGWFGPPDVRHDWKWLAKFHGLEPDAKAVPKDKFRGTPALYDRLDRDGDGAITPNDLDWSDRNPFAQQHAMVGRLFRRMDTGGDGKLTREDAEAFFKLVTEAKDHVTADDLRRVLLPRGGYLPGDAPTPAIFLKGFFAGEIGSFGEGPKVGDRAPDFTLKTADGRESVTLSKLVGPKPVVLVLGTFTCGPFRGLYPDVESVYERFENDANFLMVYVRDPHPTDGWAMESNVRAGVAVKQPTTLAERSEVCELFRKKLKPAIPVVVDDISDPVNTAYSGTPARLYVIDPQGKVAYKNGRGPFGFKAAEMEQALAMTLLEANAGKR